MVRQEEKSKLKELESMEKIVVGYARVSSLDDRQKLGLELQKDALEDCDIIFSEKQSGGDTDNRPELAKAISLAKELSTAGKEVTFKIYKLDRLSRKMFTLANLVDDFNNHDIKLSSISENLETDSLTGRLLIVVLGYVAEIELDNIRTRTKDGLRKARENGKKLGNQGLDPKVEEKIIDLYISRTIPISLIAKRCKVSESTIYNVARRNGLSRRNNTKVSLNLK